MPKDWDVAKWEGKSLKYKLRWAMNYHPQLFIWLPTVFIACPLIFAWQYWRFYQPTSRPMYVRKFKDDYIVLRDDDPKCKDVIRDEVKQPIYTVNWY